MSDSTVTRPARRDSGFTVVELVVAIGIFVMLMALVTVLMLNGLRSLRVASTANVVQAQQQNAALALTRLLRYIDNPVNGISTPPAAILQATPTSMAFFTLSGTGPVDQLPYKVAICPMPRGVETFSWAPALVNGAAVLNTSPNMTVPACTDAGATGATRRVLLPNESDTAPTLGFRYYAGATELIPNPALTTQQLATLTSVAIRLDDPSLGSPLEQTVVLVNDRTK